MKELDTITDFTDYLEKRAAFIRSGRLREAHGEESLLAYYAVRINDTGDHDFVDDGVAHAVTITRHHYDFLTKNPRYIAKKAADQVSYLWDNLIEIFTKPMLDGTSITLDGYEFDLKKNEIGARHMALLSRFARQCNGEAVRGALTKGISTDRFFRMMLGTAGSKGSETAFFIMTLKYLDWMEEKGGYEHYRLKQSELAEVYARGLLERFPYLEQVIGISCEPPHQGRGSSQDLLYAKQYAWSEEDRASIRDDCKRYGVLKEEIKQTAWQGEEFPELGNGLPDVDGYTTREMGNRKQRRAAIARKRSKK